MKRKYNYKPIVNGSIVELTVVTDPKSKVVYLGDLPIGEIEGVSARYGYRVKNGPFCSNHKSIGSAATEAYLLHMLEQFEEVKARLEDLEH